MRAQHTQRESRPPRPHFRRSWRIRCRRENSLSAHRHRPWRRLSKDGEEHSACVRLSGRFLRELYSACTKACKDRVSTCCASTFASLSLKTSNGSWCAVLLLRSVVTMAALTYHSEDTKCAGCFVQNANCNHLLKVALYGGDTLA